MLENIWKTRNSLGMDLQRNLGIVTPEAVQYLCSLYPFLQLIHADALFSETTEVKFISEPLSGWIIHDYDEALSTAAPQDSGRKKGVMAQVNVVSELVNLIATRRWSKVELIAGTVLMSRLLWIESKRWGFELTRYEPTDGDRKCCSFLMEHIESRGEIFSKKAQMTLENDSGSSGASGASGAS